MLNRAIMWGITWRRSFFQGQVRGPDRSKLSPWRCQICQLQYQLNFGRARWGSCYYFGDFSLLFIWRLHQLHMATISLWPRYVLLVMPIVQSLVTQVPTLVQIYPHNDRNAAFIMIAMQRSLAFGYATPKNLPKTVSGLCPI